jgi:uncharacterized protein (DUF488 family)
VKRIWTVGHSTRTIDEFTALLEAFGILRLADVRRFPGSRRYPQYNKSELGGSLAAAGIDYYHFPELGGRRKPKPDSQNSAWRNESFRGYADHMATPEFHDAIARLTTVAGQPTAIMCSEALWWRCHRALISDYLKVRGVEVTHILDFGKSEGHPFTSAATITPDGLSYSSPQGELRDSVK